MEVNEGASNHKNVEELVGVELEGETGRPLLSLLQIPRKTLFPSLIVEIHMIQFKFKEGQEYPLGTSYSESKASSPREI